MIRLENNYIIAQYQLKTAIHQWKSQIFWIWVFLEISAFDLYSLLPGSLIYHKIWQIISTSVQIVDCCVHTSTAGLGVTSPFDADAAVQKKEEEEEGVVD